MSTRSKLAIAALLTFIAAPAFAGDQDSAALAVSSGRYLATDFDGAHASAVRSVKVRNSAPNTLSSGGDFQLDGR